jgi:ABC-2 type transport system permease protein
MIGINAFMLSAFGSVAETAKNTELMLSQYPEAFIKAMSLDKFDMTNILHYYASRSYILITLFGSIYAVMLSSSILSKEESERTIEFLISKPITRNEIVSAKYLCVIIFITLFNILFSASNFMFMQIFKINDFSIEAFLLVSLGGLLVHLIFATICYLISVFITKTKVIISVSFGVVFITYFFSIMASIEESLSFFKYLSPFSYYSAEDLVINASLNTSYLIISIVLMSVSVALTFFCYSRKDITA